MYRLFWLLAPPFFLLAGLYVALTDAQPRVSRSVQVSLADLDRGKAIVDALGLRRIKEGEVRQLVLSENDLDQGVNYLAHHLALAAKPGSASAQIVLSQLIVRASFALPGPRRYVNLEWVFAAGGEVMQPLRLRVGKLALPARLAGKLVAWSLAYTPAGYPNAGQLAAARSMLDSAQISGQNLVLRFTWRDTAMQQVMRGSVALGVDEAALKAYRDRLQQTRSKDFAVLLGEAFALAQQRSKQADPIVENRAALTSLAETVLGSRLLSRRGVLPADRRSGITLAGRQDFAQHFALSAFLAATGGERLSDLAGLYKELKDAEGGSGFSFNDLAADRAGSRLGEASTRSRASALNVQKRLAGVRDAQSFFPPVRDLPEFMKQAEFQRRFGGVGQPAYQRMIEAIEARIAGLAIYSD